MLGDRRGATCAVTMAHVLWSFLDCEVDGLGLAFIGGSF